MTIERDLEAERLGSNYLATCATRKRLVFDPVRLGRLRTQPPLLVFLITFEVPANHSTWLSPSTAKDVGHEAVEEHAVVA